jgi:MoaA/NifB/PqqE/SkfB family radical SAM enzyme
VQSIYRLIKLNKLIGNHRVKFAGALFAHALNARHLFLRFDPVMACNLRCTMCYFSDDNYRKKTKGIFTKEEIERIGSLLFSRTLQLVIGCGTEPTLYADYAGIVSLAKAYHVPFVGLTTNGMLLTERSINALVENKLDEIALSVHGVRQETYERFMVNASFNKLLSVLQTLEAAKQACKATLPNIRLNYTVNAENLDELDRFFDAFGSYAIKTLQVRPVMDIGGQYRTPLQGQELERYKRTVARLSNECHKRGIVLLANTADPSYQTTNYHSLILDAVKRYISPEVVWRSDFNWRIETYDEFCRRIGWSQHLLQSIFTSKARLAQRNTSFSGRYAARYEVSF